jgi:peptide/nickel transport system substrate-binding protein
VPRPSGRPSFAAGPKIAYVDRVEWHTIPDAATAAAALQSGEVDWWEQPQRDLMPMLRKHKDILIEVKERGGLMGMIRFNHLVPPFDNPAIRRALLGGVNQTEYMTAVMGDERDLWNDAVASSCQAARSPTAPGWRS